MRIKKDLFKVWRGQTDEKGQRLEPEQQTVQHVFQGSAPVNTTSPGILSHGLQGNIPLEIVAHSAAHEFARQSSAQCGSCKYFNRTAWLKMLNDADNPGSSEAERHSVNSIRAEILLRMPDSDSHAGGDGDYDVEHSMKSMGMCYAMREYYKSKDGQDPGIMGVWPTSSCPEELCTPDKPRGLFKPKDLDAEKIGTTNYDNVMNTAAGRL